jgi:glycosyltransferase involved in cell wall biosynthesis
MTQQHRSTGAEADILKLRRADGTDDARAPLISVVIPTCNEAKNLPYVLSRLPSDLHEVIVVDGHSVDDSVEVARSVRPDVRMVLQERMGRDYAVASGLLRASGDILGTLDADGSADPRDVSRLVAALTSGADYAQGTRCAERSGRRVTGVGAGSGWMYRTANLLRTGKADTWSGCTAFWMRCRPTMDLERLVERERGGNRSEIDMLVHRRMARAGMRITEVPVHAMPARDYRPTTAGTREAARRVPRWS